METLIRFFCPDCGKLRKANPDDAGKWGRCSCGSSILIPGKVIEYSEQLPDNTTAPSPPPAQRTRRRKQKPTDDSIPIRTRSSRTVDGRYQILGVALAFILIGGLLLVLVNNSNRAVTYGAVGTAALVCVFGIIVWMVAAAKKCSWFEGLGHTASDILALFISMLSIVFVVIIYILSATPSSRGGSQPANDSIVCPRCGAIVPRALTCSRCVATLPRGGMPWI